MGLIDNAVNKDEKTLSQLEESYGEINKKLTDIDEKLEKIKTEYYESFNNIENTKKEIIAEEKVKSYMAKGNKYFYLSGWVPQSSIKKVENLENTFNNSMVEINDSDKVSESPPTKLKNNKLIKPFENIVNMYGTPNYNEIDPTSFLALTYILLYGMMFGDLGQGIIFILASFLLKKKWKMGSDLLLRTGVSASIFGLFYGSFFGLEDVIPTLVMKPFDNIMPVLAISIMFGIIIMLISYCLGIYNKLVKQKDLEEGIFGKEGLAGMLMMISFILLIAKIVILNKMPFILPVGMLIVSILMEIFKQPLSRTIENISPKYDTSASDYYLENSFSIIEAILSVFSNLVSFTRVGAFAINHVGLFMAFEVMASLVGGIGSFIILLLGNIIIIGLEGMVVFIQCLRLEYYELFSKYYKGDGEKFSPLKK
ncbi:MAG: V-type ATPase 116kDa subunit family protein [Peptoniphilaceae bacterium]|nr:V-type ATPase 116kDa subunit family protein [Peptoniphilaceae bacterium]